MIDCDAITEKLAAWMEVERQIAEMHLAAMAEMRELIEGITK